MSDQLSNVALRFLGTRHDASDLSAADTRILSTGACVYVESANAIFALRKESTETADGVNIVAPVSSPGRWFRLTLSSLVNNDSSVPGYTVSDALSALSAASTAQPFVEQDTWYLHPDGEPDGNGLTPGTAITQRRFMQLTGTGAIVNPTMVHVIGNMASSDPYLGPQSFLPGAYMQWVGEANTTLLGPVVLSGSNMTARWTITVAGIDWSTAGPLGTSLVNKRVRITASAVPARVGVVAWISGVVNGDPATCYINQPMRTGVVSGTTSSMHPGDTIVVEELTSIGPMGSMAASYDEAFVDGDLVTIAFSGIKTPDDGTRVMVFEPSVRWDGCELNGFSLRRGYNAISGSRVNLARWDASPVFLYGCSLNIQAIGANTYTFVYDSTESIRSIFMEAGASLDIRKPFYFWDWDAAFGGGALYLTNGSQVKASAALTGTSSIANTFGLRVAGGAKFVGTQPTIQGSLAGTKDFEIAGVGGQWAVDYPVADPNHAAFLVPAT